MLKFGSGVVAAALIAAVIFTTGFPTVAGATDNGPSHVGSSAIVVDAGSGAILYQHNATDQVAPASLTKIFTSYFAIQNTPLQRRMVVEKDDLVGEASAGLNAGDNLSFDTLLHGLMLASGNDAAMTIARNVGTSRSPSGIDGVESFISYVNDQLPRLGIHDTRLANPHGLDADGHFSTARDVAAITMLALQNEPDFLRAVASPGYSAEGFTFTQRNQLIGNYPGAIGGKTGITDNAGYCLMGIANRDGRTIISVIMGSTADAWYSDVMALLDHGFDTPVAAGQPTIQVSADPMMTSNMPSLAVQGMSVQQAADGSANVKPIAVVQRTEWNVIQWPVGATLAMLVLAVVVVQGRALLELQKRPMARRRTRPAARRSQPGATLSASFGDTQQFSTQRAWEQPGTSWSVSVGD